MFKSSWGCDGVSFGMSIAIIPVRVTHAALALAQGCFDKQRHAFVTAMELEKVRFPNLSCARPHDG